jgi:hypothetical protein
MGKGESMRYSEKWHFVADENVGDGNGYVFNIGIRTNTRYDMERRDEQGNSEGLPKAEEEDAFDAEKFGHRSEGFDVIVYDNPEHGQAVKTGPSQPPETGEMRGLTPHRWKCYI